MSPGEVPHHLANLVMLLGEIEGVVHGSTNLTDQPGRTNLMRPLGDYGR
jgi:hypothetical protein